MTGEISGVDTRALVVGKLDEIISKFNDRVARVGPEIQEIVREHFGVLGEALEELKRDFSERLANAVNKKGGHDLETVLGELNVLDLSAQLTLETQPPFPACLPYSLSHQNLKVREVR